jgi:hypothetical protein
MSRRPVNRQRAAPAGAFYGGSIEVLGLEFGAFERITPLNDRFIEGRDRLRLTLDVKLDGRDPPAQPAASARSLRVMFPSLRRHLCCGDNDFQRTFFQDEARWDRDAREADETVDIAHLLEHLVIEFQHSIALMKTCSGVTCGYETPRNRFDVFVESPGRSVSLLSVGLALHLMDDLLAGAGPNPVYQAAVGLARHLFAAPWTLVTARSAALAIPTGRAGAEGALELLADLRHIEVVEPSINYSRVTVYALAHEDGSPDESRSPGPHRS